MRFPFQLSTTAEFDVVGFGSNAVDHLIEVDEYPSFNSKIEFSGHTVDAGGEVATTLVGLQRLGLRTAYAGRFGEDREGELGLKSLDGEGIDTSHAETVVGASTQIAFVIIDRRSGERTILWQRDANLAYGADDAPLDLAERGKVLHMTPHDTEACIRMATRAKEKGVIVSLDVDRGFAGLERLLPFVDIMIGSCDFAQSVTAAADHETALRALQHRFGCPIVGATLGKAGSMLICEDRLTATQGFQVPDGCRDTTGAGDAFRTGFLYGLLAGEDVEESCRLANAVAALKCRKLGARAGLPTADELEVFIKYL